MIFLQLFWEFLKTGLFAVGGGLATLPFLKAITHKYPWFTANDLMDMVPLTAWAGAAGHTQAGGRI